jgi:hypothetical protein
LKAGEMKEEDGEKREEKKGGNGCRKDGTIRITRLCIGKAVYGQAYLFY